MEQNEMIKVTIFYFLVIIIKCETYRFLHPLPYIWSEDGFGGATIAGYPAVFFPNRIEKQHSKKFPINALLNEAQYSERISDGRNTHQYLINAEHSVKNRGRQASHRPKISPYTSNKTPLREFMTTYPKRIYEKSNHDTEFTLYNQYLLTSSGKGYANPTTVFKNDDLGSWYRLYDESQTDHLDSNKVFINYRSPNPKFKKPNGQTRVTIYSTPYDETSKYIENTNKESHPNEYLVVRPAKDNSSGSENEDPTNQDNFKPDDCDSSNDYEYYLSDLRDRFTADYNAFL